MSVLHIKIWMWKKDLKQRKIAKLFGRSEQFVCMFLKGKKTSQNMVNFLVDKGCPRKLFKNGRVLEDK